MHKQFLVSSFSLILVATSYASAFAVEYGLEEELDPVIVDLVQSRTSREIPRVNRSIRVVTKKIYGEIGLKSGSGFSLIYERERSGKVVKEVWFPYQDEMVFTGYRGEEDIQEGDVVSLTFKETVEIKDQVVKELELEERTDTLSRGFF